MEAISPSEKHFPILKLPVELLINVFSSIPSFSGVVNLAATCKHLQQVWQENLTTICNQVAITAIPYHSTLRQLLADRKLLPIEAQSLTIDDVIHMTKTSQNADKLVEEFEKSMTYHPYHDPQVPNVLSSLERGRFIRSHYRIWGLLRLNAEEQKQRIESMNLKKLCVLSDILCNFHRSAIEDPVIDDIYAMNVRVGITLQQTLRRHRNKEFRRLHNQPYRPILYTHYEKDGRYAWWCDCQQETFKKMVIGSLFREGQQEEEEEEGEEEVEEKNTQQAIVPLELVWDDSSDEEN